MGTSPVAGASPRVIGTTSSCTGTDSSQTRPSARQSRCTSPWSWRSTLDLSTTEPKPWRFGGTTGGPPASSQRRRKRAPCPVPRAHPTLTLPPGAESEPYLALFVASSWMTSAIACAAAGVRRSAGPLTSVRTMSCRA
jgi:hypothetical protein